MNRMLAIVCFFVSVSSAGVAGAQTLTMDTRQARTGTTWDECMARAKRSLTVESWNIGGAYGAGVNGAFIVAWRGAHGVMLQCQLEPNGGTYYQVTMSGMSDGNLPLVEALMRQMTVPSNTPDPDRRPPVPEGLTSLSTPEPPVSAFLVTD